MYNGGLARKLAATKSVASMAAAKTAAREAAVFASLAAVFASLAKTAAREANPEPESSGLIRALASGGGTESRPSVGAAPQVKEQLFMCMYGCNGCGRAFTNSQSRRQHEGKCSCKRTK